ncbi:MAG: S41 family peptidase [Acidobacteriota bacterium]
MKAKGQGKDAYRGRVVVLIDEKTASAAEIFAAGLQEAKRAVIVGRQSSGDVLGSLNYKLPHGFYVDIPIWDYQTANGARLEGRGVIPNEVVTLTLKDFLANRDLDILRAQESLLKP